MADTICSAEACLIRCARLADFKYLAAADIEHPKFDAEVGLSLNRECRNFQLGFQLLKAERAIQEETPTSAAA